MSAQSDQLDDALSAAQQALEDAADAGPYTADIQAMLDQVNAQLQNVDNNLAKETQQAIVTALSGTGDQLKKLNATIAAFDAGTDQVTATLKKVSSVITGVVGAISAIVTIGGI